MTTSVLNPTETIDFDNSDPELDARFEFSIDELSAQARMLRSRANSLVAQAGSLPEPLAATYRRRANELNVEAHLIENVLILRQS